MTLGRKAEGSKLIAIFLLYESISINLKRASSAVDPLKLSLENNFSINPEAGSQSITFF